MTAPNYIYIYIYTIIICLNPFSLSPIFCSPWNSQFFSPPSTTTFMWNWWFVTSTLTTHFDRGCLQVSSGQLTLVIFVYCRGWHPTHLYRDCNNNKPFHNDPSNWRKNQDFMVFHVTMSRFWCVCFLFFKQSTATQRWGNNDVTTMSGRDIEPLLLSKLCDRGTAIQPTSSIVTRRFFAESRFLERDGNGYVFYTVF